MQPSGHSPVGEQTKAGTAVLGSGHSHVIWGRPQVEDKQNGSQHETKHETEADLQRLEQEFVHDVYNAIAPHFSATRFAIWPKVLHDCCAPFDLQDIATLACRVGRLNLL